MGSPSRFMYLHLTTFGKRKGDWTKASWLPIGCYYIRPRLAACCASAAHATVNRDGVGQHPHSRQRPPRAKMASTTLRARCLVERIAALHL